MNFILSPKVLKMPVTSPQTVIGTKLIIQQILVGSYYTSASYSVEFEVSNVI